jgi:hypothetical protein
MRKIFAIALSIAAPFTASAAELMVCPPWELTVVDESGKPVAGAAVVQEWGSDFKQVYVTGSTNAITDADGRVSFPARHVEPPGESRWKKIERSIDREPEGKPGSSVFISKPGYQFELVNSRSESRNVATRTGLRTRVVLKPEKH